MKDIRLLPLVIGAAGALLLLKAIALTDGGAHLAGFGAALAESGAGSVSASGEASGGSRDDILESLRDRRRALDEREGELDLRERLLEATRARVEERIADLRALETRIEAVVDARDEEYKQRFGALVTMYESMKPRDAANIFNRLEMPILARVAGEMNARRMAEVLAAMDPDAAHRLTVELSAEPRDPLDAETGDDLPQIVGTRPGG